MQAYAGALAAPLGGVAGLLGVRLTSPCLLLWR
jgi:hypothetical protein